MELMEKRPHRPRCHRRFLLLSSPVINSRLLSFEQRSLDSSQLPGTRRIVQHIKHPSAASKPDGDDDDTQNHNRPKLKFYCSSDPTERNFRVKTVRIWRFWIVSGSLILCTLMSLKEGKDSVLTNHNFQQGRKCLSWGKSSAGSRHGKTSTPKGQDFTTLSI